MNRSLTQNSVHSHNLGAVLDADLKTVMIAYDRGLELVKNLMDDVRFIKGKLQLALPEVEKIKDYHKAVLDSLIAEEPDD